jgi:hypothetical protein
LELFGEVGGVFFRYTRVYPKLGGLSGRSVSRGFSGLGTTGFDGNLACEGGVVRVGSVEFIKGTVGIEIGKKGVDFFMMDDFIYISGVGWVYFDGSAGVNNPRSYGGKPTMDQTLPGVFTGCGEGGVCSYRWSFRGKGGVDEIHYLPPKVIQRIIHTI